MLTHGKPFNAAIHAAVSATAWHITALHADWGKAHSQCLDAIKPLVRL
jgi:hypothetical protein